jgi:hypothetical protein
MLWKDTAAPAGMFNLQSPSLRGYKFTASLIHPLLSIIPTCNYAAPRYHSTYKMEIWSKIIPVHCQSSLPQAAAHSALEVSLSSCRRAQTERAPKLREASLLNKLAAIQQTQVQRLSPENKGGFLCVPFWADYRNGGAVQLIPYIITCYFIGYFNLWVRWPFSGLQVTFPNSGFPLFYCSTH